MQEPRFMCGRFGSIREHKNRVMDRVEVETPYY